MKVKMAPHRGRKGIVRKTSATKFHVSQRVYPVKQDDGDPRTWAPIQSLRKRKAVRRATKGGR